MFAPERIFQGRFASFETEGGVEEDFDLLRLGFVHKFARWAYDKPGVVGICFFRP